MSKDTPTYRIVTPEFVTFGHNLAKPRTPNFPGAAPKYSISVPLAKADADPILVELKKLAKEFFPGLTPDMKIEKPNGDLVSLTWPFEFGNSINQKRIANGKSAYEDLADKIVFRATAGEAFQPQVIDLDGLPVDPRKVTNGSTVRASLNFKPYEAFGGGISAYLNGVLLVKVGQSGNNAADAFKAFLGSRRPATSEVDPFQGL